MQVLVAVVHREFGVHHQNGPSLESAPPIDAPSLHIYIPITIHTLAMHVP